MKLSKVQVTYLFGDICIVSGFYIYHSSNTHYVADMMLHTSHESFHTYSSQ